MLTRLDAHRAAATTLTGLDDGELAALLEGATPLGTGIGGTAAALDVDGVRVFVKRVPLTDLELRPENVRSTANLFGLPTFFQYGVGSAGFGAWRELAVHEKTTAWVLGGEHAGFPLLHHWRVLPGSTPREDDDDLERTTAYWGGSAGVRARLEALRDSSAHLVLFLEFLPRTVHEWLLERVADGGLDAAIPLVHRELLATADFLRSRGVLHFDAHFNNLLTDGERLYFADFGLAISSDFDLSPAERDFFAAHRDYDRHYVVSHLLGWFDRNLDPVPEPAAVLARRYRAVADAIAPYYRQLRGPDRDTRYPSAALERAWELPEGP
ncbi:hypothetical protein [Umezawaea sp.]|uniref:hypothetical protein n=1 Tax=Umezawaea sp. TaxID=1955258 RepID=UPI002ED04CB8